MRLRWSEWGVVCVLAALAVQSRASFGQSDFEAYWHAGAAVLRAEGIYSTPAHVPFRYSPAAALVWAPFALMPLAAAKAVWTALNVFLLSAWLLWCGRRFARDVRWAPVALLLLTAPFARAVLGLGQVEGLLLLLVVLSLQLESRRPVLAGALWATACAFKPPMLLFGLRVAARRQWTVAAAAGATALLAAALPVLVYGVSGAVAQHGAWRAELSSGTPSAMCHGGNQSVAAMICTFVARPGEPAFAGAWVTASLALVGAFAWWTREDQELRIAALFYGTALLSPIGWATNLVAIAPMLGIAVARARADAAVRAALALPLLTVVISLAAYDLLGPHALREWLLARGTGLACLGFAALVAWRCGVRNPTSSASLVR